MTFILKTLHSLSFIEAALGCKKSVSYTKTDDCQSCSGSGVSKGSKMQSCKACHGSGQEMRSRGGFVLYTTCRACNGQGSVNPRPCSFCNGKGFKNAPDNIDLDIPAGICGLFCVYLPLGISSDTVLKVSGAGNVRMGRKGDLLVQFKVTLFTTLYSTDPI